MAVPLLREGAGDPRGTSGTPLGARCSEFPELARRYVSTSEGDIDGRPYETLKAEAQLLAALSRSVFIHMARRLLVIRDRELYRLDGYDDFRSFVDGELPLSRSTVYNYIDIVTYFGVQPVGHGCVFEYSKLIPALPLLRSGNPHIPKEQVREKFVAMARSRSKRDILSEARLLRLRYGLAAPARSGAIARLAREVGDCLGEELSETEREALRELRRTISLLLERGS